ncbi:MAG: exodeoxyribonuclease VII large subunit [Firmicutes bacterium]|nr:exodeoxyribonuclease VII large subunit [Bacillota bacterium]
MAGKPITVSQLNEYIKNLLQTDPLLRYVRVEGDITYYKPHNNGNIYLTISDGKSKLQCVIFNNRIDDVALSLTEGDAVIIEGSIGSLPSRGEYSLWVRTIERAGEGELAKEFERLKNKLEKEGLFAKTHKKPLPRYPKHIGVVTSDSGAAFEDIKKILCKRTNLTDMTLFPVLVQGRQAAGNISETIDYINEHLKDSIDLLIVGRGGGAPEDLAAFNDEGLARAIYRSEIPIISAVGHEIDISISDLVADVRAETPTAAAQIAVRDRKDILGEMNEYIKSLGTYLTGNLLQAELSMQNQINIINNSMREIISSKENEISSSFLVLKENDPRNVLDKGFAIVSGESGKPITSAKKLLKGKKYVITLNDGKKDCRIE